MLAVLYNSTISMLTEHLTPLKDTTYGQHLWTPLMDTTYEHHFWTPLMDTTAGHQLSTPHIDTTYQYHISTYQHHFSKLLTNTYGYL